MEIESHTTIPLHRTMSVSAKQQKRELVDNLIAKVFDKVAHKTLLKLQLWCGQTSVDTTVGV